ncbi:MAG: glucose 1-dehydrogenase [Candidatus Eisenbacteria bacterium]|uniref:Glucose 1-dehydrogenase n=1 Tax=Eiseniibacteriota bacterium TaxID=2212470 RepID=A0A9D6L4J7_UNCEI|nr:glucose 1-dehydrogenase [Candidatus Eisenbacteria bacterium]MBI3539697.1 glucose 1-dehydrogenase [Candidatus Eisenbacteria bacterium]
MSGRFTDRVALVTGASSGIGCACAIALGAEGASVVAAGRRAERLAEVVKTIEASGGRAAAVTGDVREPATCAAWVAEATRRFGGLDGLVNAAGVIGPAKGLTGTEPDEWDRMLDSNLRSVYLMSRAAAPALIERKGSIVSISSVAGLRPYAGLMAYCVSKAGVDMFTQCAALDLAPHGVRVNAVNPGVVVTELHTVTNAIPDYAGFLERSKGTHPIGRVGKPEEIASLVLYLMSPQSGWITGACVSIDGGRALASAR